MSCFGDDYKLFTTNSEYGEKYQFDANFKGPKTGRSATDVNWLWVFLVFASAWFIFGIFVLTTDPNYLMQIDLDPELLRFENSIFDYLKQTLWCYLGPILIASVICMIYSHLMRWIAAPAVWISIFITIAGLIYVATIFMFVLPTYNEKHSTASLVSGVIFLGIAVILVVYSYWQRQKIFVAIALIKEASKAVAASYSTVFFPIIPCFFRIAFLALFTSILAIIAVDSTLSRGTQIFMHMLNFFGFLWVSWFIDAFVTMVLAHTYSSWYWTLDKTKLPCSRLTEAVLRTARYHLGTVALGSMIITIGQIICHFIRILVNHRYGRIFNLCCNVNGYVQRMLQFLNRNTFIMVAIHGNPFCKSMRDAFNLLMRNFHSVLLTNRITQLPFVFFNILIAGAMGGLTYVLLPKEDIESVHMFSYPIAISVFGSLVVGVTFYGVYIMAIDTLFLCFLEDCERNDGTAQKPYYMSATLMRKLRKSSENALPPPYEHALPPPYEHA